MKAASICNTLEITRWLAVFVGIQAAYYFGDNPAAQIHILAGWLVIPMAGLTGLESVFFADAARQQSGYAASPYQRQSGLNNLALALTTVIIYIWNWGSYAELAVLTVLLIFLSFSGCNHAWSAIREKNHTVKNLLRPAMTLLLLVSCLPILWSFIGG